VWFVKFVKFANFAKFRCDDWLDGFGDEWG
jgi:hypothetical protein